MAASRAAPWLAAAALLPLAIGASQTLLVLVPAAVLAAFVFSSRAQGRAAAWPAWLLLLLLGVINSLKWPESDLADYYRFVDHVVSTPLWDVFATSDAFVSIHPAEVLFKAFVALWLPLGQGAKVAFTLASTVVIYGSGMLLGRWLIRSRPQGDADAAGGTLVLCAAVLFGFTFSVTAHLTRQYLAGAVFFSGLFLHLLTGRGRWLLLCAAAVLVHRSAFVLAPSLLLMLAHRRWPRLAWAGAAVVGALGLVNPIGYVLDLDLNVMLVAREGQQGALLMALDALLVLGVAYLAGRRGPGHAAGAPVLARAAGELRFFAAAFAATLFATHEVPLVMFRSYFYLEYLRVPLLALLFHLALQPARGVRRSVAAAVLVALGALVCWGRTQSAEWEYADGGSPAWQLPQVIERWGRIEDNP